LVSSPRPLIPGTSMGLRVTASGFEAGDRIAVLARSFGDVPPLRRIGTVAVLEGVRRGSGGDAYLDASGRLLVEVETVDDAKLVSVTPVDAPGADIGGHLVPSVERALRTYLAARVESGESGNVHIHLSHDPVAASHEVASHLRISWPEVQELLEAGSADERLERALLVLRRETGLLRSVLGGKEAT